MEKAFQNKIPLNGSIELLPMCNMSCDMCYVHMDKDEVDQKGGLKTSDEWLNLGRQMKDAGVLYLLLTGGEPLLYKDFKNVYEGLRKLGMIITLNTNGTLIDENWANYFAEYKPRRINITLYGPDENTYDRLCHYKNGFSKTMKAIRLLRERDIDLKLNISVAKYNRDDIGNLLDIADEFGLPVSVDTYMLPTIRERKMPYDRQSRLTPEEAAKVRMHFLKRELGKSRFDNYRADMMHLVENPVPTKTDSGMTCYAGSCSFAINWQGHLRPCVILSESSIDVTKTGFLPAWEQLVTFCQTIRTSSRCSSCAYRPICRTCPAAAMAETGAFDGVSDYICRYAKESYRLLCEM